MTAPLRFGDVSVHHIVEQVLPLLPMRQFFPALTEATLEEHRHWLAPRFMEPGTDKIMLCVQGYLVRTPHHTILVDSCVGNDKPRPNRPVWNMMRGERFHESLAAAGVGPGDIDYVMCTHLHVDHVGWNTRLDNGRWVPTFPKAKYLFADRELAHWTKAQKENPEACPWITDSVLPIVAAGRSETVKSDHAMGDLVRLVPTPGHTIDHFSVQVGKSGADGLITGDMIHSPIQARYPELGMFVDFDSKQSGETRRRIFERFCDTPTTLCTAHFPLPSTGRVVRWDDGFRIAGD